MVRMTGEALTNFLAVAQGMCVRRRRLRIITEDINLKNAWDEFDAGRLSTNSFLLRVASIVRKSKNTTQYEYSGHENDSDSDGIRFF